MEQTADIEKIAKEWNSGDVPAQIPEKYYCATRDVFQARLDVMIKDLVGQDKMSEGDVYMDSAIAGEIGNNSFDHNLGNWPDTMGIFFGYQVGGNGLKIVLADRGQGIMKTLEKIRP